MGNRLTELLSIELPIIQGGMFQIAGAKLTAAVSNAGGLGTLGMRQDPDDWAGQIRETRALTGKPYAVNLPMHASELGRRLDIVASEKVPAVVTAAGNPAAIIGPLKEAGCKVMHVVASARQAEKVEAAGVDAVIAEGGESGGLVAKDRVSTMVLVPLVRDRVSVPVVAAGGMADVRGMVAALALGADGVQIGTAFITVKECEAPDKWKQAILDAAETDTEIVPRGKAQGRALKAHLGAGGAMAGQIVGCLGAVVEARDVVERICEGAGPVLDSVRDRLR